MTRLSQTVRATATFHNVGIEVISDTALPDGIRIDVSVCKSGAGPFRPAHPLVQIEPRRLAGSVVALDSGTKHDVRLTSTVFDGGQRTLHVTTRVDAFPTPTGRQLYVSATTGSDRRDGLAPDRTLATLGKALALVQPGDTILLDGGHYLEGDLELDASGTAEAPIVIRSMPGQTAVLDGTDPTFQPIWERVDGEAGLYRTPCAVQPTNAYLDGGQLFHYRLLEDLRAKRWDQPAGYAVDGRHLYVRFPDGAPPGKHRVTIPRYTTGLTLNRRKHVHVIGLTFCYFGFGTYHRGIHLDGSDYVMVDRCQFHHTGIGVTLKRDADFNTIQNCSFTESPITTWSWYAVKTGGIGYESGGVGIYSSDTPNTGNVIRHNLFQDMFDAAGLYIDSARGATTNLDFHSNLIDRCSDDGVELDGAGTNNRIYGNLIRGFLTGISVAPCAVGPTYIFRNLLVDWQNVGDFGGYPFKFNVRSPLSTRWVFIYHNTCATRTPGQHGFLFKGYSKWSDIVSRNNIYAGTTYALESWSTTNPVDFDFDNLFTSDQERFVRWARKPYRTLAEFAAATGQEQHGISVNPTFENVPQGNYALKGDSPCIDRGTVLPGFNDDYAGKAPDIGAFEAPQGVSASAYGPVSVE